MVSTVSVCFHLHVSSAIPQLTTASFSRFATASDLLFILNVRPLLLWCFQHINCLINSSLPTATNNPTKEVHAAASSCRSMTNTGHRPHSCWTRTAPAPGLQVQ